MEGVVHFVPLNSGRREFNQYLEIYHGLKEKYRHIRVVLTGKEGTGKTTICRRLKNESVVLNSREPTVGAVVRPQCFSVDLNSRTWKCESNRLPDDVVKARLGAVRRNQDTSEKNGSKKGSTRKQVSVREVSFEQHKEARAVLTASRHADSELAFLSLWDMGGQTPFQASHNVFISSHGVYLLVFRLTDFLKDKLETVRLKKWIRMIGTFSSVELNAPKTRTCAPPIIFVGTFLDKLKENNADYDKQQQNIRSSISKFPELSSHQFVKFCAVDNSLGNEATDLKMLRDLITEVAVHQDQWERQLPTTWLKLEMDLLQAREKGTRILKMEEIIKMNKSSTAPLSDVNEIKHALEYLHCTRSVIYFREFDYVINDPQWLADFFSILITDDQFLPKDDLSMIKHQEQYQTKGELTQELINGLLRLEKNKAFLPHKSILLALMEKFGLIVKMLISGPETEHPQFSETFTIPSKLVELQDIDVITREITSLKSRSLGVSKALCFVFNDVYVPDELFHRIFAHILRTYKPTSLSTRSLQTTTEIDQTGSSSGNVCLYRGFGCFEINDLCRMILSMQPERSTIVVTVFSPTETHLPADCGKDVRLSIEGIIRDALEMSDQQHFQHTHKLHCSFSLNPYDTPVDLYGINRSEKGVPCKGGDCHGQHLLVKTDTAFWHITE
ncbi:probable serine/threonine-protein kinase roco4, partial [Ylistrum balloti]|uniref:probable serine/threonine-protein kinase roco4 n=1 Tax=Ylistrum balloti TaxID=509963 RepID=UPI002905E590